MPMGAYKDFGACMLSQQRKGRSKSSASRICGEIKARTEGTKMNKSDMKFTFEKYLPIEKIDNEERMVYGYASTPDLDSQGEIVELVAIERALPSYMKFPTIREMHTANPVGRTKTAIVDKKGLFIGAKIVDDNSWKKIKEGVFNGFSIGGRIKSAVNNIIKELDLVEISLVDVPANKNAVITLYKADDVDEVYKRYHSLVNMSASELEAWSKTECSKKASLSRGPISRNLNLLRKKKSDWTQADVRSANRTISFISRMRGAEQGKPVSDGCPSKRDISLKNWAFNPSKSSKMEKASVKVGDFVEWNSSGGMARGKVLRVIREGKVEIPDSSFSITGDEENPGLLIRVYRKDTDGKYKPTKRIVGHKSKTVKRSSMKDDFDLDIIKFSFEKGVSQLKEIKKHDEEIISDENIETSEVVETGDNQEVLTNEELTEVDKILEEFSENENEEVLEAVSDEEVKTDETKETEIDEELKVDETLEKIAKMEAEYSKKLEKLNSIEKLDTAISKLASVVEKFDERLRRVENTPAESKTKASFLVEKSLGGVVLEKEESVELKKAKEEFAELMKIRETNPERYAIEKMSERAFELRDRINSLSK
jgi:HK97 family phage prohead protease